MPLGCFGCFGGSKPPQEVVHVPPPAPKKPVEFTVIEDQRYDESLLHEVQAALSKAPTDSAEARIAYIVAQTLQHLNASIARLYGWTADDADDAATGSLVLLGVDWQRRNEAGTLASSGGGAAGPGGCAAQLPDLPGQRVIVGPASQQQHQVPLLHRAVHSKAPALFSYPSKTSPNTAGGNPSSSSGPAPPDCAVDHANLGATHFAALPLTSGDRLLGVLWVGAGGGAHASGADLPPAGMLRQLATSVSMCLVGGAVDPDYLAWLAGSLRRLAASATLQALVGELCDAVAQHVRRRFFIDAVAHAAVVPDPRSATGFILDHRPAPGGPGGVARWAAATRQASLTYTGPAGGAAAGGTGVGLPPRAVGAGAPNTSQSVRRSDSFTNNATSPYGSLAGGAATAAAAASAAGGGTVSGGPRTPQRSSSHAAMRSAKRHTTLVEQATARAANAAACGSPSAPADGNLNTARSSYVTRNSAHPPCSDVMSSATAAAAVAAGVLPSLRAKGFQMSHTLLQRMVSAAEGRGPDGVYVGLTVADCGRHVQDVHQPSRDVCMLMAGGVRGADMTTDASDSNMFASERSTGRISMQTLVLVGLDVGSSAAANGGGGGTSLLRAISQGLPGAEGGGAAATAAATPGAILALYLTFPTRLPPLLLGSAQASVRQLLGVMLARLVRLKVNTDLEAEFKTLCAGVPGSYAVVPSTHGHQPITRDPPTAHQAAAAAVGAGLLNDGVAAGGAAGAANGIGGGRPTAAGMVLEPSIGAPMRASSSKLVPLGELGGQGGGNMSLGASAQLLAAYTDAGCRAATHGSIGAPGAGSLVPPADASGRVFPQTHDGSAARTHGGPGAKVVLPERIFASHLEEEEEEEDATPTHPEEEGDVMLSSDPRVDEVLTDGADGADPAAPAPAAAPGGKGRREAAGSPGSDAAALDEDDLFPDLLSPDGPAPRVMTPTPAAVLTVSEADGTSSMRQHMGLLVESLMSTLRSTAQMEDHFDSAVVSARRSMDLELDDLRLSGVLGDGGSGVVLCGMLGTVPVAVKIIQMPEVDQLLLAASTVKALGTKQAAAAVAAANGRAVNGNGVHAPNGAGAKPLPQPHQQQQQPANQRQASPPQCSEDGSGQGNANGGGGGAVAPPAASLCSSKVKQARRDMLRNAMELAVMRSISHVNIATVYAVYDNVILERVKREGGATAYALRRQGLEDMHMDKTGSKPVFVALCMELCDSGSLASKLEERSFPRVLVDEAAAGPGRSPGRPRGARVLDMVGIYLTVLEVACALRYLHARRLLHRDIKSANILLKASPTDPRGWTCKLADFGSALVLDQFQPPEEMPGNSAALGSPDGGGEATGGSGRWYAIQEQSWGTITHMSPESMDNNSRVDASSDIYALGIVMWEISSGRGYRPYKELAPEQIGAAVRKGLRPTFTSEVPLPYRTLAQQCWAAEPHKRPSAVQVVAQVKAQLSQLQAEGRSHRSQYQQQQQQPPAALPRS